MMHNHAWPRVKFLIKKQDSEMDGAGGPGCRSQKKVADPILSARLCVFPLDSRSRRSQSGQSEVKAIDKG